LLFSKKKEKEAFELDKLKIPSHIAIIMDGNGRWAKKRGLPRSMGHREGGKVVKKISNFCADIGVRFLTLYAFSTENWKRPKEEVEYLMDLLVDYLVHIETHLDGREVRVRVIGDKSSLSPRVREEIEKVESKTQKYNDLNLTLAINYGSRAEITYAFKEVMKDVQNGNVNLDEITEEDIREKLYTSFMPEPDILIRPGGEQRMSNYLLWQCAYAELFFLDVLWPDFSNQHIEKIILEFQKRNRRYGGI
jgi:undecaprenyl diphosphate synthase